MQTKGIRGNFELYPLLGLITIGVILSFSNPGYSQTGSIEKVFVVVIDGLRYSEAFGDSSYRYIPHLGNILKPNGTLYTDVWNLGDTNTAPGHMYIVTGNWVYTPQYKNVRVRTIYPTIFEYYRKAYQVPQEKVWVVVGGKISFLSALNYSLNPAFGPTYQASLESAGDSDVQVWEKTIGIIESYEPSLVFINFGNVDYAGHHSWEMYTAAIRRVDRLIYSLWTYLENHPQYQGKTALLVTTDHGRHDELHGGFLKHGGICPGCKQSFLLAVGPGIRKGVEIREPASLVDIAPTVGYMLQFPTPFAKGRVLSEMFVTDNHTDIGYDFRQDTGLSPGTRLTYAVGASVTPQIAASGDILHLVWEDNREGTWQIYYKRSEDGGSSWSADFNLSRSSGLAVEPSISVFQEKVSVIWKDYRNNNWDIYLRQSLDAGQTWSPARLVARSYVESSLFKGSPMIVPGLPKVNEETDIRATVRYHKGPLVYSKSEDGGVTWGTHKIIYDGLFIPSYAFLGRSNSLWVVWTAHRFTTEGWEIWYNFSFNGGDTWGEPHPLLSSNSYLLHPAITVDEKYLYLVWSDFRTGHSEISFLRNNRRKKEMPSIQVLTSSKIGAIFPTILKTADRLYVAWEDNRDGNKEIYYKTSPDNGLSWSADMRITHDDSNSTHPDLAYGNKVYLVWQDDRDGNWEIYFEVIDDPYSP
ncbi:MAG: hypothetical protein D6736_16445 [Nitrospinota bacterium]|nr:MAG: hypothetical protein D6736_16445 [Nitrospinota bacterium]